MKETTKDTTELNGERSYFMDNERMKLSEKETIKRKESQKQKHSCTAQNREAKIQEINTEFEEKVR